MRRFELSGTAAVLASVSAPAWIVADFSAWRDVPSGAIVVADHATPDAVLVMERAAGFVFASGGIASHGAILAREAGRPCLVGVEGAVEAIPPGATIEIDAEREVARVSA